MMTQHNESSAVKLDNEQLMQMAKLISQSIAPGQAKQWEGSHILVNDYMTEWLEAKHGIDIVQKTYENYEGRYRNHIKPFFEGKTLMDATPMMVNRAGNLRHRQIPPRSLGSPPLALQIQAAAGLLQATR